MAVAEGLEPSTTLTIRLRFLGSLYHILHSGFHLQLNITLDFYYVMACPVLLLAHVGQSAANVTVTSSKFSFMRSQFIYPVSI
jgi:hypothetical protein